MNNRLTDNPAYITSPFDAWDTRDLPPLNELRAAWDKPLEHEDPLMNEDRKLLSVAQYVRDYSRSGIKGGADVTMRLICQCGNPAHNSLQAMIYCLKERTRKPVYYTLRQVSDITGIKLDTLGGRAREHLMPAVKDDNSNLWLVAEDDIVNIKGRHSNDPWTTARNSGRGSGGGTRGCGD